MIEKTILMNNFKLYRNVVIGNGSDSFPADVKLPKFDLEIDSSVNDGPAQLLQVSLNGSLPWVWKDCINNHWETIVLASSANHKTPYRFLIEPFLHMITLAQMQYQIDGTECLINDILENGFTINVVFKNKIKKWTYDNLVLNQLKTYLTLLTRDFINHPEYDILPFALYTQPKFGVLARPDDLEATKELKDDFYLQLQEAVDDDNNKYLYRASEVLSLIDLKVPADAFDKVRRRTAPIFEFVESEF